MKKIGIMGGTFNPIHVGHLMLAERAMDEHSLDEIWLIPTGCSYMKAGTGVLDGKERLKMCNLAVENHTGIKCLDIEIKREGNTYSYETLEQLKESFPDHEFHFIFGADCLFTIENWKYPERIFACCKIIAAVRNDASTEEMEQKIRELEHKFKAEICLLMFPRMEISSTDIRERIRMGKSVRYMIPDNVISYINEKRFYTES